MTLNKEDILNSKKSYPKRSHVAWNKGKHIALKPRTGKIIICKVCGKEKYFELNQLKKRPCEYCSIQCAKKASRKDKLAYSSIHSRIKIEWGKANYCEVADDTCSNTFDWANVSGEYLLERIDWMQLCRKHHIAYDKKEGKLAYKNFNIENRRNEL